MRDMGSRETPHHTQDSKGWDQEAAMLWINGARKQAGVEEESEGLV